MRNPDGWNDFRLDSQPVDPSQRWSDAFIFIQWKRQSGWNYLQKVDNIRGNKSVSFVS